MKLLALKNYFLFKNTLIKFRKRGYGHISEMDFNILFSIHQMNQQGILCCKSAVYSFLKTSNHTPHKKKFSDAIQRMVTAKHLNLTTAKNYKILSLSVTGKLVLSSIDKMLHSVD